MRNGIFLNFLLILNENYSLTDENKAEILAVFQKKSLMFQQVEVIKHMM